MNILVTIPSTPELKKRFAAAVPGADLVYTTPADADGREIESAEVILGNIPPQRLKSAKNLKWLQLNTAGADTYCAESILPPGVILTNATGAFGLAISEYMLGVILEINYNLHRYRDNQYNRLWFDEGPVRSVSECTVLVVGMGNIGGTFARKIKSLGSYVIGIRRTVSDKPDYVDELYTMDKLDELLPRADIVTLSLPQSPSTVGLFNEKRLLSMQKDAILINVGRGSAVCTDDLCRVLQSGHLKGCALDVTDPEPLPADSPLWNLNNAVITPHISGGYHIHETMDTIIDIMEYNLKAYQNGEPLKNIVDFKTGYRFKS